MHTGSVMLDRRARALAAFSFLVITAGACADRRAAHDTGTGSAVPAPAPTASAPQDERAGACTPDTDCHRTGCSGEVCSDRELVTSCLWRPEYACYSEPYARCACNAGTCGWVQDPALTACIAHARAPTP